MTPVADMVCDEEPESGDVRAAVVVAAEDCEAATVYAPAVSGVRDPPAPSSGRGPSFLKCEVGDVICAVSVRWGVVEAFAGW